MKPAPKGLPLNERFMRFVSPEPNSGLALALAFYGPPAAEESMS